MYRTDKLCDKTKRITKTYNGSTQVTENGRIISCSKELISHHIHSSELHTTLFLPTSEGSPPNARKKEKKKTQAENHRMNPAIVSDASIQGLHKKFNFVASVLL